MLRKTITVAALAPSVHAADFSGYRFCGMASNYMGANAGPNTSCAFAKATIKAWATSHSRDAGRFVRVYSPTTHRTYTMRVRVVETQDSPYTQFTGGNGASVRMTS
jgi:hypothetical protein